MASPKENLWFRRGFVAVFVVLAVMAWRRRDQIKAAVHPLLEYVDGLGPWAPIILAAIYIPACLCMVPNTFLSPGVGFLLGPVLGSAVATIGLTLGACANFLTTRVLGREWFHRRVPYNRRFRAVELACHREGFKIVFLTRLTPVFPSNVMSYFFGVTSVPISRYAVATALGMLPRTLVYTSVGAAAKSFAETSGTGFENQPMVRYALYVGGAVTLVVLVAIARIARRALDAALDSQDLAPSIPITPSVLVAGTEGCPSSETAA